MTYRLKPLVWEKANTEDEWWTAETVFGTINVEVLQEGHFSWRYCFDEYYDEAQHDCESIADGKAKAEAFYLSRIEPALEALNQT